MKGVYKYMLLSNYITQIDTIGELYFVCELGKFLYCEYGEVLDLEGVTINEELTTVAMWDCMRIAYYNKYIVGIDIDEDLLELDFQTPLILKPSEFSNLMFTLDEVVADPEDRNRRTVDQTYDLLTPKKARIAFEQMTDDYWVWSFRGKVTADPIFYINNETFYRVAKKMSITQTWVSLLAWVSAHHIMKNNPQVFIMLIQYGDDLEERILDYILDVINKYSDFFDSWFEIKFHAEDFMEEKRLEAEYKAWYRIGRDLNYTKDKCTISEKLHQLKKADIEVGDVVLVYTRQDYVGEKGRGIETCNMGVVKDITPHGIYVTHIYNHKTYEQSVVEWEQKPFAVQQFYGFQMPFSTLNSRVDYYQMVDIAIGNHIYTELNFIVDLNGASDETQQTVLVNGQRKVVYMEQNDLIYWILKEHKVQFNEDKFLEKYFYSKNKTPLWLKIKFGEDITAYEQGVCKDYYFTRG